MRKKILVVVIAVSVFCNFALPVFSADELQAVGQLMQPTASQETSEQDKGKSEESNEEHKFQPRVLNKKRQAVSDSETSQKKQKFQPKWLEEYERESTTDRNPTKGAATNDQNPSKGGDPGYLQQFRDAFVGEQEDPNAGRPFPGAPVSQPGEANMLPPDPGTRPLYQSTPPQNNCTLDVVLRYIHPNGVVGYCGFDTPVEVTIVSNSAFPERQGLTLHGSTGYHSHVQFNVSFLDRIEVTSTDVRWGITATGSTFFPYPSQNRNRTIELFFQMPPEN